MLAKLAAPLDAKVSDVAILLSMPGVGLKTAAVIYSECLPLLVDGKIERLRAVVGVAPVTKQSGKQKKVTMRYACNERLRHALFHVANTAVRIDGRFKAKYEALIARGHHHARALRSVADLQLRVLVAMMKTRTTYQATPAAVS